MRRQQLTSINVGTPPSPLQPTRTNGLSPMTPHRDDVHDTPTTASVSVRNEHKRKQIHTQQERQSTSSEPFHAVKDDTFGSAASRTRTLPVVSFVFPKKHDRLEAEPYHFRREVNQELSKTSALSSLSYDVLHSNPFRAKANMSLDDILYPKVTVTTQQQQPELSGTEKSNDERTKDKFLKVVSLQRSSSDGTLTKEISQQLSRGNRDRSNSDGAAALKGTSASPLNDTSHNHRSPYLSGVSVAEAVRDKVGLRPRSNSTDGELKLPQRGLCDERKVLEKYQWKGNIRKVQPRGFNNLGNTCFLNSTLQCLAYCPPFCQSLVDMPPADATVQSVPIVGSKNKFKQTKEKGSNQGKKITLMLGSLFRQVHGTDGFDNAKNHTTFGGSLPISPRSIVQAVPSLGSASSRNGYKFCPGRQEDAHEFFVHLLNSMNEGELREAGIHPHKSGWRDRLPVPRLDETTFIHRIFGGYLRSQVRCTACGYSSNTYDPFLDLSLEISRETCHSIASSFQEFTRKETLDTQNRWKCSGCKKRVCATKQLTVFRPPLSLCIQLKRFSYDGSFGGFAGRMGGKKISKPIEFPANLKLPLSDGRSCGYSLTGIVIHVGGSSSSGHYTAYVKKPGKDGGDKWYHMDDSFVQSVTEQDVLRQRNAYILMYCRKEVKLEFPTPPLRESMTTEEAKELSRSRAKSRSDSLSDTLGNVCLNVAETKMAEKKDYSTAKRNSSTATALSSPLAAPAASASRSSSRSVECFERKDAAKPASDDTARSRSIPRTTLSDTTHTATTKCSFVGPIPKDDVKLCLKPPPPRAPSSSLESSVNDSKDVERNEAGPSNAAKQTKHILENELRTAKPECSSSSSKDDSSKASECSSSSSESTSSASEKSDLKGSDDHTNLDRYPATSSTDPESSGKTKQLKHEVTRITLDRGESGKIEVMMGPRYKTKKTWQPKTKEGPKDEGYDLLGNLPVSKWEDDDDYGVSSGKHKDSVLARAKIAKQMQRAEEERKRKMYPDRHDAQLDQGKVSNTLCS